MPPPLRSFYAHSSSDASDGLSLQELCQQIEQSLHTTFSRPLWVIAEVSQVSVNKYSKHCYLDLVETKGDKLLASMRATIWSYQYARISQQFFEDTGLEIKSGMTLLMLCYVRYSPIYGLSLNIEGISSAFTLGQLSQEREKTIQKLQSSGVWDMNRSLPLDPLIRKVAVISSVTAAGWGDFRQQLLNNNDGIRFAIKLFPAIMQGEKASRSIIAALDAVMQDPVDYDVLVLIRGGGSKIDLQAFDDYLLCDHLSQFPLPILTGIGHDRDQSVADLIAYRSLKTPTAVAEYILESNRTIYIQLAYVSDRLHRLSLQLKKDLDQMLRRQTGCYREALWERCRREQKRLEQDVHLLTRKLVSLPQRSETPLLATSRNLEYLLRQRLQCEEQKLEQCQQSNRLLSPQRILGSGYALCVDEGGQKISSVEALSSGDSLRLLFADGRARAEIKGDVEKIETKYLNSDEDEAKE